MRLAARCVALLVGGLVGAAAKKHDPTPSPTVTEHLLEALTGNLLVNGGPDVESMAGWDDVVNGGSGWRVMLEGGTATDCSGGKDDTCENAFQTSYVPCTRRQTVALEVPGKVDAALLDSGTVAIHVSEEVKEFFSVDKYFIRVALCADKACKHKVARWAPCKAESAVATESSYSWCDTEGGKEDPWRVHNYTFGGGEVPGARWLMFEDGGVDSEYFEGFYGPWFRRAQVIIHSSDHTFKPSFSPAPTPVSEPPTKAPTPAPSLPPGQFDDLGYGAGDYSYSHDDDDASAAATPAPKADDKPHHKKKTPAPSPGAEAAKDPFRDPEAVKAGPSSPTVAVKYAAFAVLAVLGGFGIGYLVRKKRDAPTHEYGIAGTSLDEDEEGVEMAGFA